MSILEYLEKHLPTYKASQIIQYLAESKCVLKITKPRKTKRGDFRQSGNNLSISVNHDTNSFRFLFTLIHEIAHLKTYLDHGNRIRPHGDEWKRNFEELFYHFQMEDEFGKDEAMLLVIKNELKSPKACSGVNLAVEKAFTPYDDISGTYLDELLHGENFEFRGHRYQKLESRRTRVMCLNLTNNRKYTINKAALVEVCE
jgi:SprT protein